MGDNLVDRLRRTRPGYEAERVWHKFLLDAYAGTGGFEGSIRMPFASYWGAASDMYGGNDSLRAEYNFGEESIDTYLDRFMREDTDKFSRRVSTSQYPNYIEPIVDIRLSYMHRKEMTRTGTEPVQDWMQDVNGLGTTWDRLRQEQVDFRAALLGWTPVLFDRTNPAGASEIGTMSRAQASALGVRTVAIPLYPGNLLDWDTDEYGVFQWAKLSTWQILRPDPLGEPVSVQRVTIWTRDSVQRWDIHRDGEGRESASLAEEMGHNYGRVPVLIAKHKPSHDDPVKGLPIAAGASKLARKLFNYLSELDEHMRSSVFAFLQVPTKGSGAGEVILGSSNAMQIPMGSSRDLKYVSPDPSVAETLETRIKTTVEEMYRTGRSEFARANVGGSARESGAARMIAFENSNRAIADFAANMAAFDEEALKLVAALETGDPFAGESIDTIAPTRFGIEELSKDLDDAMGAISVGLGPTAEAEIKRRLISKVLPNLDPLLADAVGDELDDMRKDSEQAEQFDDADDDG